MCLGPSIILYIKYAQVAKVLGWLELAGCNESLLRRAELELLRKSTYLLRVRLGGAIVGLPSTATVYEQGKMKEGGRDTEGGSVTTVQPPGAVLILPESGQKQYLLYIVVSQNTGSKGLMQRPVLEQDHNNHRQRPRDRE